MGTDECKSSQMAVEHVEVVCVCVCVVKESSSRHLSLNLVAVPFGFFKALDARRLFESIFHLDIAASNGQGWRRQSSSDEQQESHGHQQDGEQFQGRYGRAEEHLVWQQERQGPRSQARVFLRSSGTSL